MKKSKIIKREMPLGKTGWSLTIGLGREENQVGDTKCVYCGRGFDTINKAEPLNHDCSEYSPTPEE